MEYYKWEGKCKCFHSFHLGSRYTTPPHPHRCNTNPSIPKPQLCLYVFLRFPQINTPVASRTQKLKTPCRSEQELSSFTDAEVTNKSPNLSRSDGARVYLNGIQLHGFPRFSFCASALEKRAPFRLIVKLIQIILSLIQRGINR